MNTITHTTTRRGESWEPSMAGVGSVGSDEVTKVRWNDSGETTLVVAGTEASVWHAGKRYQLKWICGSHETVLNYWLPRIEKRLKDERLQDRVRNWKTEWPAA